MHERYRLDELIGKGGAGAVYKGFDTKLQRVVAIKKLLSRGGKDAQKADPGSQGSAESLWREAKTISGLHHPNIVTVFDIGVDRGRKPFVVMELINGENLNEVVSHAALTYEDFLNVATQALEGLNAAHASGVLHRDIKPSNFMLEWLPTGKYQVKLLDFGLAKITQTPSTQTVDQGGAVLGSINFMAPEQFERKPLDPRTDLYSLGAVFYFALTSEFPFRGESLSEIMRSHLHNLIVPLAQLRPDLPPWLCQWVHWLLKRQPENRPQSATDALHELNLQIQLDEQAKTLAALDLAPRSQRLVEPVRRSHSRAGASGSRFWKWFGVPMLMILALAAAAFFVWDDHFMRILFPAPPAAMMTEEFAPAPAPAEVELIDHPVPLPR